jgi:Lon protease-like protein
MPETHRIPLFPLGVVLLPGMALPLHIFEERYKLMISECIEEDKPFGIVLFDGKQLYTVGCMARVTEVTKRYEDGRMDILTRGGQRFLAQKVFSEKPYMEAYVSFFEDADDSSDDELKRLFDSAMELLGELPGQDRLSEVMHLSAQNSPAQLSFSIAALEDFSASEKQRFLEMTSTAERIKKGVESLARILERARLTIEISGIIGGNGSPPERLLDLLSAQKPDEPQSG